MFFISFLGTCTKCTEHPLCADNPFPCLESKDIIRNRKGIKMVSSYTEGSLHHCTAGDKAQGRQWWKVHATLLPSMWHLKLLHTHSTVPGIKNQTNQTKNTSCPWLWATDLKYLFHRMALPSTKALLCLYLMSVLLRELPFFLSLEFMLILVLPFNILQ